MEEEQKETQETQATGNGAPNADDLTVIKAELEAERQAKAAAQAAIADKDTLIAKLQAEGEALRAERSNLTGQLAELTQLKDAHSKAVARYLDAVKLANPTIPGDVITGGTIEEIEASVQKATAIATAVKANLEAQARNAKVPAGAPTRTTINLEGLSPREKIAAGLTQQGGT